jgi:hypothetical protein
LVAEIERLIARRQFLRTENAMTRWEYLFLTVARRGSGTWKVWQVNGEEVSGWQKGPSLYEYCNEMGEQGWEMIELSHAPVVRQGIFGFGSAVDRENFRVVMKRSRG